MRPDKFTQKMQEALEAAQEMAAQFSQQELPTSISSSAALDQTDGVTSRLLEKMGVAISDLRGRLTRNWSGARRSRRNIDQRIGMSYGRRSTRRRKRWRN